MKYTFKLPTGAKHADWQEDPIEIKWDDEIVIPQGWHFGGKRFEVTVTDRKPGKHRRNIYMDKPRFFGGVGMKLTDCNFATILNAEFEDLRPMEERNTTAIKMVSKNKANGYKIVNPSIVGYERAGHFLGNMEGGRIDFARVVGGWRGNIHELKWNDIEIFPGPEYIGGHFNVAHLALGAPAARQMTIFRTNFHENLVYPVNVWPTQNPNDNYISTMLISPGGSGGMAGDFNWPQRWKTARGV